MERDLYTLKMAKKVCEDWASILLNDKTEIVVDDKASSDFLLGADGTGGILGSLHFWREGNALVEKAFYSGTGAFVLKIAGMRAEGDRIVPEPTAKIRLNYLPADCIIPITIRDGAIVEAAFASEVLEKGEPYVYLEIHELDEAGMYVVKNHYFSVQDGTLSEKALPDGILPELHTLSPTRSLPSSRPISSTTLPVETDLASAYMPMQSTISKGSILPTTTSTGISSSAEKRSSTTSP